MDRVETSYAKAITAMLRVFLKADETLRLYSEDHHFSEMFVGQFEDRLGEQLVARDNPAIESPAGGDLGWKRRLAGGRRATRVSRLAIAPRRRASAPVHPRHRTLGEIRSS